jgi:hypothetical protein
MMNINLQLEAGKYDNLKGRKCSAGPHNGLRPFLEGTRDALSATAMPSWPTIPVGG